MHALRSLFRKGSAAFKGEFYSTEGLDLEPYPARQEGVPIWIGSWGSAAGLRRTARLGDGWLASAYNTTPVLFKESWERLGTYLNQTGRNLTRYPNPIATMLLYITEERANAEDILQRVISPAMNRPIDELRERLLVGPAEECAEKVAAYQTAGAQRIFLWPVADEINQLEKFWEQVVPLVS